MHKEAKKSFLWRLLGAGALLGAMGLIGADSVPAQDAPKGGRIFRRMFKRSDNSPRGNILQVQNEQPQFQADEKERVFEEPGIQTPPPAEDSGALPPQPAFEQADDKEKAFEEPEGEEAWTLTNLFNNRYGGNPLKERGWKISGHSAWGYQNAPDGAFTGNGPFDSQQEWGNFNLDQQYLYAEKIADGSKGFDWGARADIMYGVDGNEAQSFGNVNPGHWDYLNGWDHGAYEWAMPQLYGEVAYEDLSVKIGHFYTIVGYEVVPAPGQFFFSRQLTFYNSEPFTHTGALATYKVNDKLTVLGGWVLGMDTGFYQYNAGNAFLGGFTYKIDDKTDFVYSMTGGNLGWRGEGAINSLILSRKWTDRFTTVHQFDVLDTNLTQANGQPANFADFNSLTPRDSTGFINYAFYDINKWLKAGVRYEWFKADGVSYNTFTYGVNIKPYSWLLIRPEVRTMWAPGNQQIYQGVHGYSGNQFNQTVFGIDAILLF